MFQAIEPLWLNRFATCQQNICGLGTDKPLGEDLHPFQLCEQAPNCQFDEYKLWFGIRSFCGFQLVVRFSKIEWLSVFWYFTSIIAFSWFQTANDFSAAVGLLLLYWLHSVSWNSFASLLSWVFGSCFLVLSAAKIRRNSNGLFKVPKSYYVN